MNNAGHGEKHAAGPTEQITAADRHKAQQRHLLRYRQQFVFWMLMTVLAAASYPLTVASMLLPPLLRIALGAIPLLILGGTWAYHGTIYKREQEHEWDNAVNMAQATLNPQATAAGYSQVFGVYIEAKRRSSQLITCAAFLFVYALAGAAADVQNPPKSPMGEDGIYAALIWLELGGAVVIGFLLLSRAYVLGSSCLPGDVIVRHTLALAIHATSNVNDPQEAKRQVEEDTQTFMRVSPWWFYSG